MKPITLALAAILCGCTPKPMPETTVKDIHSSGNPRQIAVRHVDLDLAVSFADKTLKGAAVLWLQQVDPSANKLILDTRDLKISSAETSFDNDKWNAAPYQLGPSDKILGQALTVELPHGARFVRIRYATAPTASGLQWLEPAQTAGKVQPFLFSQNEPIAARSWIPLQDSPAVRVTYSARITVPAPLKAVMSAEHDEAPAGTFRFHMNERVPAYLIALAVGDIAFEATGTRTGVYAEPPVVHKAAKEFEDMEKMLEAAEHLFGPYRWGRYDVMVLPPSFPFGGMENPRLTFATPTVLAGDKSLVSLVAHEMAHSWSGNLVTNATWSDFWLNEGFTVYIERRIQEAVYGRKREEMEAELGRAELMHEMAGLPARDTVLHVDLTGRDPDDGMTLVPYEKGYLLLRQMEETFGRERFDTYLRSYFDHFAFQSITTAQSLDYLKSKFSDVATKIPLDAYVNQPGLPEGAPDPKSPELAKASEAAKQWAAGKLAALPANWSTQELLHFLRALPPQLTPTQMAALDQELHLTVTGNNEILQQWLLMSIASYYQPANPALEQFLLTVGRRKYIKPLYAELIKTPDGKVRARAIYDRARAGYHPMAQATIDALFASH